MKQKAYFTTPLPTPTDLSAVTGASVDIILEDCHEPALFTQTPNKNSPLTWNTISKICQKYGYEAVDHRMHPKLNKEQEGVIKSGAEFHKEYAQLHKDSGYETGKKISSIHESFKDAIETSLTFLKTKGISKSKLAKDLADCQEFHNDHLSMHKKLQTNAYSQKMISFHNSTSQSIKKGIEKVIPETQMALS
jgi:hypothetical protein